jgi:dienelactone hydrolase
VLLCILSLVQQMRAFVLLLMGAAVCYGGEDISSPSSLQPYFQPPTQLAGQFGKYRSPLTFNDGSFAKTAQDWERRRKEILNTWHGIMGPWPALLPTPTLEFGTATNHDGLLQNRVRVRIAEGQTNGGRMLVPTGAARKHPAVLVVYYEPETSIGIGKEPLRDFGYQLALRGFVTLSIGTPGGDAWKPELGAARCQPLSFHAYVAANCWQALANLPNVDSNRIGIVGHSYGGKWAMFAGALWDRFAAVAVSDPGIVFDESRPTVNYWEPWYLGSEPDQQPRKPGIPSANNPIPVLTSGWLRERTTCTSCTP